MIDRETARKSASTKFGHVFWLWYALPFILGKAAKALCYVALVVGVLMLGNYIADNAAHWGEVLGQLGTTYLVPAILVAVGVVIYAVGAALAWRHWGWLWRFKGLNAGVYTAGMCAVMIGFVFIMGVTL